MSFITAESATTEAIKRGFLTEGSASTADVVLLITLLEIEIASWLRWNPVLTEYHETVLTTTAGACLTSAYPIVQLTSITSRNSQFGFSGTPIAYAWSGSLRTISTGIPAEYVRLVYRAGLDPMPAIFGVVVLNLCMKAIENGFLESGSLDFLNESNDRLKALNLPGGLGTTYQDNPPPSNVVSNPIGLRLIDKFLAPLIDYQRSIIT